MSLCEFKSHLDSPLSSHPQNEIESWLIWAVLSNSSSSRIELAPATYGVIPQMTVSCKTVMSPSPHSLSKISKEVSKKN
jgi:hypothetical protein